MIRYKLIKKYPLSPELGTIVQSKNEFPFDEYFSNGHLRMKLSELINFPENWQKVEELDYEILSIITSNFVVLPKNNIQFKEYIECALEFGCSDIKNTITGEIWSINSVKRLSDGEVFTIGDLIDFGNFENKGSQPIEKFEIDYFDKRRITAYNSAYGLGFEIWKKVPTKTPLFTSEDGVEIFEGDDFFYPNTHVWVVSKIKADAKMIHYVIEVNKYKTFSSEEKAEEYILMNKPCLSLNETKKLFKTSSILKFEQKLIELVKSKLKLDESYNPKK